VASLGLVSPGAVTDGVTLFYPQKNWRHFFSVVVLKSWLPFFSHRHHFHPLLVPDFQLPSDRFSGTFCKIQPQKLSFIRVSPRMVSPHP